MSELDLQIRDYFEEIAPPLVVEDLMVERVGEEPVQALRPVAPRRPGWAVAAAAAIVVLLLVGGVAWLVGTDRSDDPAVSTTVAPTTVAPTTVAPTTVAPTTVAPPSTSTAPDALTPQLVDERVTPTSIGDASWSVYDNPSVEVLEMLAAADFGSPQDATPALPSSLLSGDGIATSTRGHLVATAGETTLTQWSVEVDWNETVLLFGGDDLAERSANGDLLHSFETFSSVESGSVATYLLTDRDEELLDVEGESYLPGKDPAVDAQLLDHLVAKYEWTSTQSGDVWVVTVVDSESGEPVGSVTSTFPLYRPDPDTDTSLFTLSQGSTVEVPAPVWFDDGFDWFALDSEESMLVYARAGDFNSSAPYEIWQSDDGLSWQNLGLPAGFPSGHFIWWVSGSEGLYVALIENLEGDVLAVRSENGIDWVPTDLPSVHPNDPRFVGSVHRVDTGWVLTALPDNGSALAIWTSPDGITWQRIETSQILGALSGGGGTSGWTSSGNTVFVTHFQTDPASARLWVLEFPS